MREVRRVGSVSQARVRAFRSGQGIRLGMAAGTAPPPPPRRRVSGTRAYRAGSQGRGGIRERGQSGGCRRAVRRAMGDGGRARRGGGDDRFASEILVSVANLL